MKDQIQIVSLLLTRKCNLSCSYCAISRNYKNIPSGYPKLNHYHKNEMSTEYVIEVLSKLKLHNPNVFILIYGGEPLLRKDLPDIINFCHRHDVHYTIISNNTDEVEPALDNLIMETGYIEGYTFSIDPLVVSDDSDSDRVKKSKEGLERVLKYKKYIKDLVAEVTIDNRNIEYIVPLVRRMTELDICSDLTFIDIAHTPYYDFSNITDKNLLVKNSKELRDQFEILYNERVNIHLGRSFYNKVIDICDSTLDCGLDNDVHNITIDADGTVRLCLRIRGLSTPKLMANKCFTKDFKLDPVYKSFIYNDKKKLCRGCNWSCAIMSQMFSKNQINFDELAHSERRL